MNKKATLKNDEKSLFQNNWFWVSIIVLTTFIAFFPALQNGFTNWDDGPYVEENLNLQELNSKSIKYWLTEYHHGNYHPLTMLTYLFEYHFEQLNPKIYHTNNLILHLVNVVLCFLFVFKLTGKRIVAIITALFFGIHPMHVESVAWVSERKDVLYTLFFLWGLIKYLTYLDSKKITDLIWVGVLFLLSILSKPAALTFSLLLPLIDFFKGRTFNTRVTIEKIPFIAISVLFGIVALKAQDAAEALADAEVFTYWQRTMFASYGIITYFYKLFYPIGLSCFHPYPTLDANGEIPFIFKLSPFIVLAGFGFVAWSFKKTKVIVFGILFYLFNLVLVLQFVSIGNAIIAERYSYVPYIGLFMIIGYGINWIKENKPKLAIPSYLLIVACSTFFVVKTQARCKDWKGAFELWDSFVKVYPTNDFGRIKRGEWLAQNGKEAEGLKDFEWIAKQNPKHVKALLGIANIAGKTGNTQKALEAFNKIIEIQPKFFEARVNRAITYSILGKYDLAFKDYEVAQQLEPNNLKVYMNRGFARVQARQYQDAIEDYNKVLAADKRNPTNFEYRGIAYFNLNKFDEAIKDFSMVLQLNPRATSSAFNRGVCFERKQEYKKALADIELSIKLGKKVNQKYLDKIRKLAQQ